MPTSHFGGGNLTDNRYLNGGVVKILVGPDQTEFNIHDELLRARSKYFASALSGQWRESDGIVELSEDDPKLFRLISHWLYTDTVDLTKLPAPVDGVRASLRLYVLADRLQMQVPARRFATPLRPVSFLNVVERDMHDSRSILTCEDVDYIYENTLASSPLRQFAVHLSVYVIHKLGIFVEQYRESFENTPQFAIDLCKRMTNRFTPLESIQDPRDLPEPIRFGPKASSHEDRKSIAPSIFATSLTNPLPSNFSFPPASQYPPSTSSPPMSVGDLATALPAPNPFSSLIPGPLSTARAFPATLGDQPNEKFQNIFSQPEYERTSPEVNKVKPMQELESLTSCRS